MPAGAEFNNFEIALLLLEHRLGGGNTAAQILRTTSTSNMVTCSSFRNRFAQVARGLAAETERRATRDPPCAHPQSTRKHLP